AALAKLRLSTVGRSGIDQPSLRLSQLACARAWPNGMRIGGAGAMKGVTGVVGVGVLVLGLASNSAASQDEGIGLAGIHDWVKVAGRRARPDTSTGGRAPARPRRRRRRLPSAPGPISPPGNTGRAGHAGSSR